MAQITIEELYHGEQYNIMGNGEVFVCAEKPHPWFECGWNMENVR